MKFTAAQIAGILEGEVEGNPNAEVHKLSKIEEGTEGSITFLSNPKYTSHIYSTEASVTIVKDDFVTEEKLKTTLIKVKDPYESFTRLLEYYNKVQCLHRRQRGHWRRRSDLRRGKDLFRVSHRK